MDVGIKICEIFFPVIANSVDLKFAIDICRLGLIKLPLNRNWLISPEPTFMCIQIRKFHGIEANNCQTLFRVITQTEAA